MLRPDIQAEIILSFQEEKRQELARIRQQRKSPAAHRPRRARLLRASGALLITAGGALLRLSGAYALGEADRRLGEAA